MITTTNLPESTDEELLEVLKATTTKDDPLKLDNIRDVLMSVFLSKQNILETIESYTTEPTTSQLKLSFVENAYWRKESEIKSPLHGLDKCSTELFGIYHDLDALEQRYFLLKFYI